MQGRKHDRDVYFGKGLAETPLFPIDTSLGVSLSPPLSAVQNVRVEIGPTSTLFCVPYDTLILVHINRVQGIS